MSGQSICLKLKSARASECLKLRKLFNFRAIHFLQAVEISCSVGLSMKKPHNLGTRVIALERTVAAATGAYYYYFYYYYYYY